MPAFLVKNEMLTNNEKYWK